MMNYVLLTKKKCEDLEGLEQFYWRKTINLFDIETLVVKYSGIVIRMADCTVYVIIYDDNKP